MSRDEYIHTVNPCYGCGCYDPDTGCSMPGGDRSYACDRNTEEFRIKGFYYNNPDFKAYVDRYARTCGVSVAEALEHELVKEVYKYYKNLEAENDKIKR